MIRTPIAPFATLRGVAAVSLILLPAALAAQRSGPLADARLGEGQLELRAEQSIPIVEGAATLSEDGTAWIVVKGRTDRFEFRGAWRQGDREQRLMTISQAMGEGANAEGWVMTKDGRLKQIEIVGRWGGGRKLRLSFLATADLPPRAPVWGGIDSSRAGDGTLERGRGRQPLRGARVVLEPGGRAELVLAGLEEMRLAGRWSEESATRVRFESDGGFAGQPGTGSGTIELRDREVERIALSGTSGALDYRLEFRAGAEPPPPMRPGRQELSEEVGYNLEGGDYTTAYFESLRECQAACRRDQRCLAYTYNTRTRTCYLKDRVGRLERRPDTVSGIKGESR
jgi:hypothetical protein